MSSIFHLLACLESTVPSLLLLAIWTFFEILFLSSVGTVDLDAGFHLIDHRSVVYLYHLQTLLFINLKNISLLNNPSLLLILLLLAICFYNSIIISNVTNISLLNCIRIIFIEYESTTRSDWKTIYTRTLYEYSNPAQYIISTHNILMQLNKPSDATVSKDAYISNESSKLCCAADTHNIMYATMFNYKHQHTLFYIIFYNKLQHNNHNHNIHTDIIDNVEIKCGDNDVKLILLCEPDALLHTIDPGSVYLIHLQIMLYTQQYTYNDSNNDPVSSATNTSAVRLKILQMLLYNQQYAYDDSNNNPLFSATVTSVVRIKITSCASYIAAHSACSRWLNNNQSFFNNGDYVGYTNNTNITDAFYVLLIIEVDSISSYYTHY